MLHEYLKYGLAVLKPSRRSPTTTVTRALRPAAAMWRPRMHFITTSEIRSVSKPRPFYDASTPSRNR